MLKQSAMLLQRRSTSKLLAGLMTIALAASLSAVAVQSAYADTTTITGGATISENGDYQLATDATGTITINEDLTNVKIIGNGATSTNDGLNIKVGEGSTLTIQDIYGNIGSTGAFVEFLGSGSLNVEGTNLIDNDGIQKNYSVINVSYGNTVTFGGTGCLYGYKTSVTSYIGGENGQANGNLIFEGGHWFIKGSKAGAVIGGDSTTQKGGDITIKGGELYLKGVAKGALIGGSNQGKAGDVYISGGLIELYEDFSGPAIGAGNTANVGNVTITGGSLKTVLSSNSENAYGAPADFNGMPYVSTAAVKATGGSNYQILAFDASAYVEDGVEVTIDGKAFYKGGVYTYVTNEVKNPTAAATEGAATDTMANWLSNDTKWLVTESDYSGAYPTKSGSSFVKENNLYFWLTKADHTMTVDGDTYLVSYDATSDSFSCASMSASLSANNDPIKVGDTFKVNITVKGKDIAGGGAVLSYDKNAITLLSIEQGSGLSTGATEGETKAAFISDKTTGTFGFSNNSAATDAGIVVATYTFEAKQASDSIAISLDNVTGAGKQTIDDISLVVSEDITSPVIPTNATKGDVNNNGKINIVDAQVVYDLINGEYGEDWAQFPLSADRFAGWIIGTVSYVADVQGGEGTAGNGIVDAADAYRILYYTVMGAWE